MMKTLGQIAYEASQEGGQQTFGPWKNTSPLVKQVHEEMAHAVAHYVLTLVKENLSRTLMGCHGILDMDWVRESEKRRAKA